MSGLTRIRRLRDIAARYDGFLLDQWGVMHDGSRALPGACIGSTRARTCPEHVHDMSTTCPGGVPRLDATSWPRDPALAAAQFDALRRRRQPVVLSGCVGHWPALRCWSHATSTRAQHVK